jgi:hypothetical protein
MWRYKPPDVNKGGDPVGIMYDVKPCPFVGRCSFATKECSEELSGTCPVIVKPEPEPVKEWDPLEPVAVTLTKEQWQAVLWKLQYYRDVSMAKAIEYADGPAHAFGSETAAQHKAEAEKVAGIIAKIEKDLGWDK